MSRWPPRPLLSARFYKAHGLGNDYLVFEEGDAWLATEANVGRVCDRFRGVGSDGIVALLASAGEEDVATERGHTRVELRMFNPDGGEFERSGNGLRVLGSYLSRRDPALRTAEIHVGGDVVDMVLHGAAGPVHDISVAMGRAAVGPDAVALDPAALGPVEPGSATRGPAGSMSGPAGELLTVVPVSVGNPHMVVVCDDGADEPSEARLSEVGPFLVGHPALAGGANVQLARPVAPDRCRALIWERGVGRTSASGTSSCAVAVAMVASGRLAPGHITVEMPGGALGVDVDEALEVVLRGPVEEVFEGSLSPAFLSTFERAP